MDIVFFGICFVTLGSAVTFFIASSVPQPLLLRVQAHGRFAGLSAESPPST